MDRRKFISGVGYGVLSLGLAGCGLSVSEKPGNPQKNASASSSQAPASLESVYDKGQLVIAQGTDPKELIKKGFAALGGIGAMVKKGSTVVIKPNFSVARKPEEAATTNPELVAAVVRECLVAGAKEVKVIDYPFQSAAVCLTNSGIKAAVEAAGGKAYVINAQSFYSQVEVGGKVLKSVLFSKDVLNADVFINFPILKHHSATQVTLGLKNMMGLVWDRGYFHRTDLLECIAELAAFRKPQLTIVDATKGIIDNGPTGPGTIREWNQVIFGADPVAVDAYAAVLFGHKPDDIGYIAAAAKLGVGEMDLQKIKAVKV